MSGRIRALLRPARVALDMPAMLLPDRQGIGGVDMG
jgi:hypothetical protein